MCGTWVANFRRSTCLLGRFARLIPLAGQANRKWHFATRSIAGLRRSRRLPPGDRAAANQPAPDHIIRHAKVKGLATSGF
jgi:hypothetical protein